MNKTLTVRFMLLGAIVAAVACLAGCNTIEGAGEDVEAVGEAVSETSRDVRD
jgi:entericidin B